RPTPRRCASCVWRSPTPGFRAAAAGRGCPAGCRRNTPSGPLPRPGWSTPPYWNRLNPSLHYAKLRNGYVSLRNMPNPFVYGEVVPRAAFVDREVELDRLTRDLMAGQKIFLISPRRYGKSSLVRQALRAAERGGALTVEVTVSSYSSYVAFLEGYARALLAVETRLDRARAWLRAMLGAARPEVRVETDEDGERHLALTFPSVRTDKDVSRLAQDVFALPARIA